MNLHHRMLKAWAISHSAFPPGKLPLVAFTAFLICAIFWTDLRIPLGVACGVPYVWVMLSTHWSPNSRVTVAIALLCSLLTYVGTLLSPPGAPMWVVVANRLLALFAIWLTTLLCIIRQKNEVRLKQASDEIAANVRRMHSILTCIREGVIVGDAGGAMEMANPAALETIVKAADSGSRRDARGGGQALPDEIERLLRESIAGRVIDDNEILIGGRSLSVNARPLLDSEGSQQGGILTLHDITERKRLESAIVDAAETERRRIGQDIHDGLIQQLTGVSLMIQTIAAQMANEAQTHARSLDKIGRHLEDSLRAARQMAHGLFPVELERRGLATAIRHHLAQLERIYGIQSEFRDFSENSFGAEILPGETATHLFRIVQEATANACRHARATRLRLGFECTADGELRLTVEDDGIGLRDPRAAQSGIGMRSMAYRARLLSGNFTTRSSELGGLKVEFYRAGRPLAAAPQPIYCRELSA